CAGGTVEQPCDVPQEPNSVSGGYGFVYGLEDHGVSERWQSGASVTFDRGNHEIKAGADFLDATTNATTYFSGGQRVDLLNLYGQLFYAHDFYAVSPDPDHLVITSDNPQGARVIDYGVFAQDSWKVLPNLTVNVGLRWDGEAVRNDAGATVLRFL